MAVNRTAELMPGGKPNFEEVRYYPAVQQLIAENGRSTMMNVLIVMIGQFCASFNVVRNMNDVQMIEAASMLLDECGNFRLEDYQMMFTLGKRGELVKVLDRIDINIISTMLDAYHAIRHAEGQRIQEEEFRKAENRYKDRRIAGPSTEEEKAMDARFSELAKNLMDWQKENDEAEEARRKEKRDKQIKAFAESHKVNIDKVVEEFSKSKKNIPNNR